MLLAKFENSTTGRTSGIISPYHEFSKPTGILVRARVQADKDDSLSRLEVRLISKTPYRENIRAVIYPAEEYENYRICVPAGVHAVLFTAAMGDPSISPSVSIDYVIYNGTCTVEGMYFFFKYFTRYDKVGSLEYVMLR